MYIGLRKNKGIAWVWTDSKDEMTYSSLWLPGEPAGGSYCAVTSSSSLDGQFGLSVISSCKNSHELI